MVIKNPKFQIGARVYHVTKESDQGVVLDAKFYLRTGNWVYSVAFTPGIDYDFYEDELSESKIF